MRRLMVVLLSLFVCGSVWAAIPQAGLTGATSVWEVRTGGAQTNGGGFVWQSIRGSSFVWVVSGSGTNEYYCLKGSVGCSNTKPLSVTCNGFYTSAAEGTVGSLTAGQWDWADNDSLGFSTVYVRLPDGADPTTKNPGYVSMSTGTDYSQQNSPQVTAADIKVVDGDTTQVYRTGATKFAAADANNVLYIASGGGLTAGWYHIASIDANSDAHLDRSVGAADAAVSTGYIGGAFKIGGTLDDDWMDVVTAGSYVYWASGHYTLGETVSAAVPGTAVSPTRFRGYTTTRGDNPAPSGTQPELVIGSSYSVTFPAYSDVRYVSWSGNSSATNLVYSGGQSLFYDCNALSTSTTASRYCIGTANGSDRIVHCMMRTKNSGTNGASINAAAYCRIMSCRLYGCNSGAGIFISGNGVVIIGNAICNNVTGVNIGNTYGYTIVNNLFYQNNPALSGTTGYAGLIANNIIASPLSASKQGVVWTTYTPNNFWAFNDWYNAADYADVPDGPGDVTTWPKFADPNATPPDFTLTATSPCLSSAMKLSSELGLAGTYSYNIGPDQNSLAGGGDFPDAANVLTTDTTNGVAGTYVAATEAQVQEGVTFGPGSTLTGTYNQGNADFLAALETIGLDAAWVTKMNSIQLDGSGYAKLSNGTGTGQIKLTDGAVDAGISGTIDANLVMVDGSTAAATNMKKWYDTNWSTVYDDTNDVPNSRLTRVSRAAGLAALSSGSTLQTDASGYAKVSPGTGTGQISLSSGAVTVGTNNDKTGYTASTVSDKTGYSVSTVSDKTGYSLAASQTFNMTGNISGNLTGDVTGKVLGTGASSITGTGARVVDSSGNAVAPASTALSSAVWTGTKAGYLDAAVSSRLESASYTAPDNASITAIKAKTDNLPSSPAAVGSAMTLTSDYDAAKAAVALNSIIDGTITLDKTMECLIAFMSGKVTVVDNGATRTITYYKRDGSTAVMVVTVTERDGSRANGGTVN